MVEWGPSYRSSHTPSFIAMAKSGWLISNRIMAIIVTCPIITVDTPPPFITVITWDFVFILLARLWVHRPLSSLKRRIRCSELVPGLGVPLCQMLAGCLVLCSTIKYAVALALSRMRLTDHLGFYDIEWCSSCINNEVKVILGLATNGLFLKHMANSGISGW